MSHFLFGIVEGRRESARAAAGRSVEVSWGTSLQQSIVIEMLAACGKPTRAETAFSLSLVGEDNADALISPYQVDHVQILESLWLALAWLEQERAGKEAELWATEGYDNAFQEVEGSYPDLRDGVQKLMRDAENVPSMRLRFRGSRA